MDLRLTLFSPVFFVYFLTHAMHSWLGPDTQPIFHAVYDMNQEMIRMTKQQQQQAMAKDTKTGSCKCNLTLVNCMELVCHVALKEEEAHGMGKALVSRHADSSLQDYSSIHTCPAA